MNKLFAAAVAALVVLAVTASAFASGWRVVKSKSASGDFAATAVSATISRPHAIAVRFKGSGLAAWACTKGFSVSSWSREYGAGLHKLPHVSGKSSCNVTASVSGEGSVRVQILKQ